jgi:hypothetical protein
MVNLYQRIRIMAMMRDILKSRSAKRLNSLMLNIKDSLIREQLLAETGFIESILSL